MVFHFLKYCVAFIIPSFYKKIQGKNLQNLKVKGPVIIAMNHPNAFTDPVAISYICYPLRLKYLARGDAFKPGIVAWLLGQIGIVPIYRIQDGGLEGLKKNDETYSKVNRLLRKNAKIIVFAEGICVQERRLRPLKKGVARMVFGAYEALNNEELAVLPIGVNYSKPDKPRSSVFYNIGEPIYVKDFIEQFRTNPARANNLFLQTLEPKMKSLITHINDKNYDEVVYQAEELCKRSWLKQQHLDPEDLEQDYKVTKQITEKVNNAVEHNRALVDEFKILAAVYFNELKQQQLKNWLIEAYENKKINTVYTCLRFLSLIIGSPLFLAGLLGNYLPFKLAEKLTKKILKNNVEFYSSITIGIRMVFFLINYALWFMIIYALSPNIIWPFLICITYGLSAWFSLYYYPFMLKTCGMLRILRNKPLAEKLSEKRNNLISLINKF